MFEIQFWISTDAYTTLTNDKKALTAVVNHASARFFNIALMPAYSQSTAAEQLNIRRTIKITLLDLIKQAIRARTRPPRAYKLVQ
jgi:hypothetical protein